MHAALAIANSAKLVKMVTLLSCETFGVLIAIIYIEDAVLGFVSYFNDDARGAALASLFVGLGTFILGINYYILQAHTYFTLTIRVYSRSYASGRSQESAHLLQAYQAIHCRLFHGLINLIILMPELCRAIGRF